MKRSILLSVLISFILLSSCSNELEQADQQVHLKGTATISAGSYQQSIKGYGVT